jgi:hypothetical protein
MPAEALCDALDEAEALCVLAEASETEWEAVRVVLAEESRTCIVCGAPRALLPGADTVDSRRHRVDCEWVTVCGIGEDGDPVGMTHTWQGPHDGVPFMQHIHHAHGVMHAVEDDIGEAAGKALKGRRDPRRAAAKHIQQHAADFDRALDRADDHLRAARAELRKPTDRRRR